MKNEPVPHDLEYIVGEEKSLREVITGDEVLPLLRGVLAAGAFEAAVRNDAGEVLWREGVSRPAACSVSRTLYLEGEPVGSGSVTGGEEQRPFLEGLAALLAAILNGMLTNNLKRMLTTEIHTAVVRQSYEELLESNRKLAASEASYRELAGELEEKVAQRTGEIEKLHDQLLQQEKMAAIGQLAAGMAHEINNPLGFVASNLNSLRQYAERLQTMLLAFRSAAAGGAYACGDAQEELNGRWRQLKIDFILADLEELFQQSEEGCSRIRAIVADLKGFAHLDEGERAMVDLNEELDKTLRVMAGQLVTARVIRKFQPLPAFECHPARLAQVFLNILMNAVQARTTGLALTISTGCDGRMIRIAIADNGPGVAPDIRRRVFEPFFTTREIGKGKGLGLSAAYEVITACQGRISIGNRDEGGAEVVILLPVKGYEHG